VLRESEDKVSFCVADSLSIFERLLHTSPTAVYPTTCSQDAIQGLPVGGEPGAGAWWEGVRIDPGNAEGCRFPDTLSDLLFRFVAGVGFEPTTSGL
jgi:hypothetical protein